MSGDGYGRWASENFAGEPVWERAPDQKYVVFKREDLPKLTRWEPMPQMAPSMELAEDLAIYDAVVIRTQDALAGPALYSYAATVALTAQLLKDTDARTSQTLQNIADYFHFRALEADGGRKKLPD